MASHLTCTIDDGVARVALDRPDKLNGLTLPMLDELATVGRRLRSDRTLRAVIITGEGRSFCAGLDFATVGNDSRGIAKRFVPRPWRGTNTFQEACWVWRRLPVPVIAAVHGHCFGGGLQLALAADYRFTTPDAQWSVMEVAWGLIPDMSGIQTLKQQVGADVVKRLAMTGEVVSGTDAVRLGLASEVADDPYAAALAYAQTLKSRSPDAIAAAKRLVDRRWTSSARWTLAHERVEQVRLLLAANTSVTRKAAAAKEPPEYLPRGARR
ncbi:MAG: crotonase/enoyl-CoA hydratase family protein [Nostocoides sp.]